MLNITRKLHALAVRLHVKALTSAKRNTQVKAHRAVKQTRLIQEAIDRRSNELVAEFLAQSALRSTTITLAEATVGSIDRELAKYEG